MLSNSTEYTEKGINITKGFENYHSFSSYDSKSLTLFTKFGVLIKNDLSLILSDTLPQYFQIFVLLILKYIIFIQEVMLDWGL